MCPEESLRKAWPFFFAPWWRRPGRRPQSCAARGSGGSVLMCGIAVIRSVVFREAAAAGYTRLPTTREDTVFSGARPLDVPGIQSQLRRPTRWNCRQAMMRCRFRCSIFLRQPRCREPGPAHRSWRGHQGRSGRSLACSFRQIRLSIAGPHGSSQREPVSGRSGICRCFRRHCGPRVYLLVTFGVFLRLRAHLSASPAHFTAHLLVGFRVDPRLHPKRARRHRMADAGK